MRIAKSLFTELIISSLIVIFFDSLVTAIFFFSVSAFILSFLDFSLIYGIYPSALFFLISFIKKLRINKIHKLEEKYPELREKLRTSSDYKNKNNSVVMALHSEVVSLMSKVDINAIINQKKIFLKVTGICVLYFLIIMLTAYNFRLPMISEKISNLPVDMGLIKLKAGDYIKDKINYGVENEYLENSSIAELGDEEMNLSLDVYNTEIDISEINEPNKNDFGESFPGEVDPDAQEIYDEKISDEYRKAIKNYFEKIK
ncbi:hypothetical protein GF327_07070 [Candidatus Woesearchaeota archaeon]|nr:hypothetical protein [Candidatus Woesearchaeota archaeon]